MTIFSKSGGIIWVYNSFLHIIVLWWNLLMRLAAGSLQLTQLTNLFLKIDAEKVLNIFFSFSLPVPVTKTRGWIRCGENRLKPSSKPQLWHSKEHSFLRPRLKEKIRMPVLIMTSLVRFCKMRAYLVPIWASFWTNFVIFMLQSKFWLKYKMA